MYVCTYAYYMLLYMCVYTHLFPVVELLNDVEGEPDQV